MASPPTRQDVGIAYFITPYQSVEQLLRLMKILRRAQSGAPTVIHLDEFRTPSTLLSSLGCQIFTS